MLRVAFSFKLRVHPSVSILGLVVEEMQPRVLPQGEQMAKDLISFVSTTRGVVTRLIDATKSMDTPTVETSNKEAEANSSGWLPMPGESLRERLKAQ